MIKRTLIGLMIVATGLVKADLAMSYTAPAQSEQDRLIGTWIVGSGKGKVKIEKAGNKYYGKLVWLKEPIDEETGKPKLDKNNDDKSKRNIPLIGLKLLKDFEYDGDDEWDEGTIYDPENGDDYSCVIEMVDINTIEVRGYVGIPLFGRTDTWKRVAETGVR
ncbi:MAG: DUF2147 domain-containing protein [Bacteroidia bacterium]